jgi:hypothetical protein
MFARTQELTDGCPQPLANAPSDFRAAAASKLRMMPVGSAMNSRIVNRSLLGTCIALSSCGGGGSSVPPPSAAAPPVISFNHVFPQGDAKAAQGTAWDIVGVKTTLTGQAGTNAGSTYDTLRVDVTFAQNISNALPAPGQPLNSGSQLGVAIAFDTDDNINTGAYETCNPASGLTPFDYGSDNGSDGRLIDGNYSISNGSGVIYSGPPNPPAEAITSVSGNVVTQSFFLPTLQVFAGTSVPKIGVGVASLNGAGLLIQTDCVPSGNGEMYTDHQ